MIRKTLIIILVSMLALACGSNQGSSGKPKTKNIPSVNHTIKQGTLSLSASRSLSSSASQYSVSSSPEVLMSISADSDVQTTFFQNNFNNFRIVRMSISADSDVQATSSTTDSTITTITPAQDTANNDSKNGHEKEYSVLTRLYDTVWFQTEEEYDDGKWETETTFLFFNSDSEMEERELEMGEPAESDYSTLEIVSGITLTTSQNNDQNRDRNACVVKNTEIDDNDTEYQLFYLKDENTLYVIELTEKRFANASALQTKANSIIKELEGNNARKYNEDKYALSTT